MNATVTPDVPPIIIIIGGSAKAFTTLADAVAYLNTMQAD